MVKISSVAHLLNLGYLDYQTLALSHTAKEKMFD